VREARKVFLEESLLEVFAGVPGHDFVAQLRRKLIKPSSENIETNTRMEQSYFRAHVVSNAGGGVQGNSLPGSLYLLFWDIMCGEELTGGVCAIDLEAFVWARELLEETEIVKCGGDVEKFRVEAKLLLTALLSRKQVDAQRMINKQLGGMFTQDVCGFFRKQGIGYYKGHVASFDQRALTRWLVDFNFAFTTARLEAGVRFAATLGAARTAPFVADGLNDTKGELSPISSSNHIQPLA
jgi:hypothetical protein